jgi:hypothetical protein
MSQDIANTRTCWQVRVFVIAGFAVGAGSPCRGSTTPLRIASDWALVARITAALSLRDAAR